MAVRRELNALSEEAGIAGWMKAELVLDQDWTLEFELSRRS